jgi:hypothetical protein
VVVCWIAEGEKLFDVGLAQSGRGLQLSARRVIEEFTDAHQAAGKRPPAFKRAILDRDEVAAHAAIAAREKDGIDGDLGPRRSKWSVI